MLVDVVRCLVKQQLRPRTDAAPHAPAADAWSFAGADTAAHARADNARPFAGADARADAISNSG